MAYILNHPTVSHKETLYTKQYIGSSTLCTADHRTLAYIFEKLDTIQRRNQDMTEVRKARLSTRTSGHRPSQAAAS